jgi:hypothetical protein
MKDELSMNPPVSAIDGSRFASAPLSSENIVTALSAPAAASLPSRVLPSRFAVSLPEESLVVDDRSNLTPAQAVENKLITRLKESSMPVSHLQMRGLVRNRYEA